MAYYSKVEYPGDGVNLVYQIPFNYVKEEEVYFIDSGNPNNDFSFISEGQVLVDNAVSVGQTALFFRRTDIEILLNYFNSASVLNGVELDDNYLQLLHALQEIEDVLSENGDSLTDLYNDLSMNGFKITELGDADINVDTDAVNVRTALNLIAQYSPGGAVVPHYEVAIEGQQIINLPFTYVMGVNAIALYVAGARQSPKSFTEIDQQTISFNAPFEGAEEIYALISDQPASAIEVPQATTTVLGGAKFATVPDIDAGVDIEKMINTAGLNYAISKIDVGGNIDNGILPVDSDIVDISQGKYYILDYDLIVNPPEFFGGKGIMIKTNNFDGAQGGLIVAYDQIGNMAVKVKTTTVWSSWKNINKNEVISVNSPDDNDGRPDGTFYYQIEA